MAKTPEHLLKRALEQKFLYEIAVGWEEEVDIARRFGFLDAEWRLISKNKLFLSEVARVRGELEKDGRMSRYKARLYANDLVDRIYEEALDIETPIDKKIDALKVFSQIADMLPKQNAKIAEGNGVNIQILLDQAKPALEVKGKVKVEEAEEAEELKEVTLEIPGGESGSSDS